jgi:ribosome-associated protein
VKNKEQALARLHAFLEKGLTARKVRKKTAPTKASRLRRLDAKNKRGKLKKSRQTVE